MSWTDERVETLKTMWTEGKSASQIAKELGGVTRNAVIGKVHRLGLSNRATTSAKPAKEKPSPRGEPKLATPKEAAPAEPKPAREKPATVVAVPAQHIPGRKPVLVPGQPLPPQPSANEISPEALASVKEVEKGAMKLSLLELTERTCKWPIGDPATEEFWFCGLPTQSGKPYCDAHVSVAFQPMSSRRDRRAGR